MREKFNIPVAHISEVGPTNTLLIDKSSKLERSSRFEDEVSVITAFCDYKNANEGMHATRNVRKLASAQELAYSNQCHYIINDPIKYAMTPNSKLLIIDTCKDSIAKCSYLRGKADDSKILYVEPDDLEIPVDAVMDFGGEIQHFSPEQIYQMFVQSRQGFVGYGYTVNALGDFIDMAQTLCLDGKKIGLIRKFHSEDCQALAVKFGSHRIVYKYDYLTSGLSEIIDNPNPNAYPFSLELQPVENFKISPYCCIRRFRVVKTKYTLQCFDACIGDEIFLTDEKLDYMNATILSKTVCGAQAMTTRRSLLKYAADSFSIQAETKDAIIEEDDQCVVLRRRRPGRIFDDIQDIVASTKTYKPSQIDTVVSKKVLNKVTLNFVNAPQLTGPLVKSNLGFINNCVPEIDLLKDGVAVLLYAIKETSCIETLLNGALQSKDAELIAALKAGDFEVAPNGLKDAWRKGKLYDYLSAKVRALFGLKVEDCVDPTDNKLGF